MKEPCKSLKPKKDGILTAVLIVFAGLISMDQLRVGRRFMMFEHLNDTLTVLGLGLFLLESVLFLKRRYGSKNCPGENVTYKGFPGNLAPGLIFLSVFSLAGWFGSHPDCISVDLIKGYALFENLRFYACAFLSFLVYRRVRFSELPDWCRAGTAALLSVPSAVILFCSVTDFFFQRWPTQMWRFGVRSQQLFYGHPTNLAMACVFLMLLLLCLREKLFSAGEEMPLLRYLSCLAAAAAAVLLVPLIMTLRIRVFGLLLGMLVLFVYCVVFRRQVKFWMLPVLGAGLLAVGWRRIVRHYFSPEVLNAARGAMLRAALDICRTRFPLGAGFGNFGSRMAQHFYSPLYYTYEMTEIEGLTPAWPSYACDSFWSMLLGETGVLGTLCYVGLMIWLFLLINRRLRAGSLSYFCALSLLLYEAVETSATLAFSEYNGYAFGLLLGFLLTGSNEQETAAGEVRKPGAGKRSGGGQQPGTRQRPIAGQQPAEDQRSEAAQPASPAAETAEPGKTKKQKRRRKKK